MTDLKDIERMDREALIEHAKKLDMEVELLRDAYYQLEDTKKRFEELETLYHEILGNLPVAVFTLGNDGMIDPVSDHWSVWTGIPLDDLRKDPSTFWKAVVPEDVGPLKEGISEAMRRKAEYQTTFRIKGKDGRTVILRMFTSPVLDEAGELRRYDGVCIDITTQQELQEKLEEKVGELERFVRLVAGREMKMAELKRKIAELERRKAADGDGKRKKPPET